jgi:hypothetical protein
MNSINEHIIRNGDEILILYGNESIDSIMERLIMLYQAIPKLNCFMNAISYKDRLIR